MARRKNKQTRKYKPLDEFRRNNSQSGTGHIDYVFGETKDKYKSFGFTSHPKHERYKYYEMKVNPEEGNNESSFMKLKPRTTNKLDMYELMPNWKLQKDDRSVIRGLIKRYKRSYNRKPKNWYVKKRKWNKK